MEYQLENSKPSVKISDTLPKTKVTYATLMDRIDEEQYSYFCSQLGDTMKRINYVCLFLNTFCGKRLTIIHPYEKFAEKAHQRIDHAKLFKDAAEFFHQMVDLVPSANYIASLIKFYHQKTDFDSYRLGCNVLKCLGASKQIIIN